MDENLRVALVIVMLAAGIVMAGYAGYLQYATLPEEHTFRQGSKRAALAVGGAVLIFGASRLV